MFGALVFDAGQYVGIHGLERRIDIHAESYRPRGSPSFLMVITATSEMFGVVKNVFLMFLERRDQIPAHNVRLMELTPIKLCF